MRLLLWLSLVGWLSLVVRSNFGSRRIPCRHRRPTRTLLKMPRNTGWIETGIPIRTVVNSHLEMRQAADMFLERAWRVWQHEELVSDKMPDMIQDAFLENELVLMVDNGGHPGVVKTGWVVGRFSKGSWITVKEGGIGFQVPDGTVSWGDEPLPGEAAEMLGLAVMLSTVGRRYRVTAIVVDNLDWVQHIHKKEGASHIDQLASLVFHEIGAFRSILLLNRLCLNGMKETKTARKKWPPHKLACDVEINTLVEPDYHLVPPVRMVAETYSALRFIHGGVDQAGPGGGNLSLVGVLFERNSPALRAIQRWVKPRWEVLGADERVDEGSQQLDGSRGPIRSGKLEGVSTKPLKIARVSHASASGSVYLNGEQIPPMPMRDAAVVDRHIDVAYSKGH